MTFITVEAEAVLDDLERLLVQARELMEPTAEAYLAARRRVLVTILASDDPNPFDFGVHRDKPLRTQLSREHKGLANEPPGANPVSATLTFNWKLVRQEDPRRFGIRTGGIDVKILNEAGDTLRTFHFDACRGGVDENGGIACHPPSHFQYKGAAFADLPRVPSLLFSPVDVLEQVLLDLWPRTWPAIMGRQGARLNLVRHHSAQKSRLETSANWFVHAAKRHRLPLRGMQSRLEAELRM